ncbi:MAG TPA: energy transducer TonB [Candidatus Kryptonia bacterium]
MSKAKVTLAGIYLLLVPFAPVLAQTEEMPRIAAEIMDTTSEKAPADYVNVDREPEIVSQSFPQYPGLAIRAGIEGRVIVKMWVDKKGSVRKAYVVKSDNEIFDKPSLDAAMKYRFSPAIYRDSPVDVWVMIPFTFKMKPDSTANATDDSAAVKYRKEMIDQAMSYQSYEQMINTYDLAMYYERTKKYKEAVKSYEEFVKKSENFRNSPKEMIRHARIIMKKYSSGESGAGK